MRALVCTNLGDPTLPLDNGPLRLMEDYPSPKIARGHVRIRVAAASINFPDALQVKGEYQDKPPLPFIPGSEVAGTVVELGDGVRHLRLGDVVCAVKPNGAFAEETVVPEAVTWKLPDGLDPVLAAAIPVVYGTADVSLRHRAQVKPGQTVLVLGAAGGVGLAAVQISLLLGAKVVAVAGGPHKVAFLRGQGAQVVIDSQEAGLPLHKKIKTACPDGVDVVFDPVGGPSFQEALKVIKWGGQYLIIGFASGSIPTIKANLLLVKNTTAHGIFWGSYMRHQPRVLQDSMVQILKWVQQGQLRVNVSHRFPLTRSPEAFTTLLRRQVLGKVVFVMEEGAAQEVSKL